MIGLMIASFFSVAWVLANAALRPIAGSVYLILAGLALWLFDGLTTVLFGGANGSVIALILFILSKLALVGMIVGLAVPARSGMLGIEQAEARLLYGCFMNSAALGAVAHILLYLLTAVGGCFFASLLIRQGAAILMANAAFVADFGTDKALLAVFTGPTPPWAVATHLRRRWSRWHGAASSIPSPATSPLPVGSCRRKRPNP
ncbi:hypothetical protein [Azospirillum argentinense]|uniref:Uncharacterized protein n=1 Tax=Azospirillum brasilense TaxID=192 RepID=A0A4D8Q575_AZOBR|nr:hypothetical protein [Azospirillum argentinense]QCO03716.1 hypothetical protein D3867_16990 [Azospirillum argentinense]